MGPHRILLQIYQTQQYNWARASLFTNSWWTASNMKSCFRSKNSINESPLEMGGITIPEMIFWGRKDNLKASISFKEDLSFTFHLKQVKQSAGRWGILWTHAVSVAGYMDHAMNSIARTHLSIFVSMQQSKVFLWTHFTWLWNSFFPSCYTHTCFAECCVVTHSGIWLGGCGQNQNSVEEYHWNTNVYSVWTSNTKCWTKKAAQA